MKDYTPRMVKWMRRKDEIERTKDKKLREELEECTFQPKFETRSRSMDSMHRNQRRTLGKKDFTNVYDNQKHWLDEKNQKIE